MSPQKLILSILALSIVVVAAFGILDQRGKQYTDAAFERAIITFGVARGLNGVISVAQGTEVALHPAGFGVNFTPGQILDPINDLIEQFSWVMLASSASLGIQKIFLSISASWVVTSLLFVLLLGKLTTVWKPDIFPQTFLKILNLSLLIALFVRFSVPLVSIGGEVFYRYFLSEQYTEATAKLEQTRDKISSLNSGIPSSPVTDNILDKAKSWFDSATNMIDVQAKLEDYKQAATDASRYAINLTVVFLIQTVIFPILFLWLIYRFTVNFTLFRQ